MTKLPLKIMPSNPAYVKPMEKFKLYEAHIEECDYKISLLNDCLAESQNAYFKIVFDLYDKYRRYHHIDVDEVLSTHEIIKKVLRWDVAGIDDGELAHIVQVGQTKLQQLSADYQHYENILVSTKEARWEWYSQFVYACRQDFDCDSTLISTYKDINVVDWRKLNEMDIFNVSDIFDKEWTGHWILFTLVIIKIIVILWHNRETVWLISDRVRHLYISLRNKKGIVDKVQQMHQKYVSIREALLRVIVRKMHQKYINMWEAIVSLANTVYHRIKNWFK